MYILSNILKRRMLWCPHQNSFTGNEFAKFSGYSIKKYLKMFSLLKLCKNASGASTKTWDNANYVYLFVKLGGFLFENRFLLVKVFNSEYYKK